MSIGLSNVIVESPDGTGTLLTTADAAAVGHVTTNGNDVDLEYRFSPVLPVASKPHAARLVKSR